MAKIAEYIFDKAKYDLFPIFNDGATDFIYSYTDVTNQDGTITRTITGDVLPTKIRFGTIIPNGSGGNGSEDALLQVLYLDNTNLTTEAQMFQGCRNLTSVQGFTSNVMHVINHMFSACAKLSFIDVSNWEVSGVTSFSYLFASCSALKNINLSNWNTQNVIYARSMFQSCSSLTSLDLSNFNTNKVTDMNTMFNNCSSLTSLDLSNFDTSQVIDMGSMFHTCSSLTSLDVSSFDTGKVTNMTYMFQSCSSLTSLDLSSFNTSKVDNMGSMFNSCTSLTSLDLSNFVTNSVTKMNYMFNNCSSLTSLDLSNFNTSQVTSMESMFSICSKLTSLDLSNFNTSQVTNMAGMFSRCSLLTSLDVSNFNTSQVANMASMFNSCSKLTSLDLSNFNTSQVSSMSSMFYGCSSLTSLDLSNFNTGKVSNMYGMFLDCTSLTSLDLSNFDTGQVNNMSYMFSGCSGLTSLDLSNFNTSIVTNMNNMFINCTSLTSLDLSNFDTGKVENMDKMFSNMTSSTTVYLNSSKWTLDISSYSPKFVYLNGRLVAAYKYDKSTYDNFIPEFNGEFANYATQDIDTTDNVVTRVITTANDLPTLIRFGSTDSSGNGVYTKQYSLLEVHEINTSNVTDMSLMFFHCTNLTYINTNFNTSKVTNIRRMFSNCYKLTSLDVSSFNTSLVTNMAHMFSGCHLLTSLDLSNWDTSSVTIMDNMFNGCISLTSLDLSNWDNGKVDSMASMFYNCNKLTSLDLSNFNTSEVTTMYAMFSGCSRLTSLDVSSFDTSKVSNMEYMFQTCSALTSLVISNFNTSNVTNMRSMFNSCFSLTSLDLSNFVTNSVTNMESMFQNCYSLTSLNVSSFDTSLVTNMYSMFARCTSLISLDLSNWDTSKVNNMQSMFHTCTSLTSLNISNFNTEKAYGMSYMFYNCTSLKVLDLTSFNTKSVTSSDDMFLNLTSDQIVYTNANLWTLDTSTYDATFVSLAGRLIASYKYNSNVYSDLIPTFTGLTSSQYTINDLDTNPTTEVDTSTWVLGSLNTETGAEIASTSTYRSDYIEVLPSVGYNFSSNSTICYYNSSKTFISSETGMYDKVAPSNCKYIRIYANSRPTTFKLITRNLKTRAIASDVLPTAIIFGESDTSISATDKTLSLLEVLSINTNNVTSMLTMFRQCRNLYYVATTFNTSKVNNFNNMFNNCQSLTSLDLSSFDTSQVTDMASMFYDCSKLTTLDLSNFNTSKVTIMSNMFYNCNKLTSLDLSNFNTSKVTSMYGMFIHCKSLTSLDVSSFNTSKVNDMSYMFNNCTSLTSLDLSSFDTGNVKNMSIMFQDCTSLTSLDVSSFNTGQVNNMAGMFNNCTSLTSLDLSNFDTSQVANMTSMFNRCSSLTSLDLSNFNTGNVNSMNAMFYNCTSLASLDLSSFNTSQVTTITSMFRDCSKLTSLDLSNFDTSKVTNMQQMFQNCSSLTSLDVSSFNTGKVIDMQHMFNGCTKLTSLDVSNFNTDKVTNMASMFANCTSLTSLDVSNFVTNQVTNMDSIFRNCPNLATLDISNFHFGGVNQNPGASLFSGCSSLKNIAMIYCRVSSFNSLQNAFNNLIATPVNVYYHDANLSELPTHGKVAYQYYGTSTVTLPYELNKLPNGVADYIDVVNGVYVQRVGKYTTTSEEVWLMESTKTNTANFYFVNILNNKEDNTINMVCDKFSLNLDVQLLEEEGIYIHGSKGLRVSIFKNKLSSVTAEGFKQWVKQNPITVLYELATPIYTPLTDEEKALLPLSAYSNGYVQLSSDELRPSKFEFRAKSSNRMQLDMLETGHYYLNAPTGNVKLGNVDINVTEMPCLIKVDNASNNRLICDVIGGYELNLHNQVGYLLPDGKVAEGMGADRTTSYLPISNQVTITFQNIENKQVAHFSISYYNTNKEHIKTIQDTYINENEFVITDIPSNAVYFRISMPIVRILQQNPYGVVTIYPPITLSKLPSHRIPTTFTQGMKSSVDFGYWEGIKEARAGFFRTVNPQDGWKVVHSCDINDTSGVVLNRINNNGTPIEDEFDVSTGKYIKRVGKITLNGGENWETITSGNSLKTYFKLPIENFRATVTDGVKATNIISDKIPVAPYYDMNIDTIKSEVALAVTSNNNKNIYIKHSGIEPTIESFKQYLSENPVTIYYELTTPEITYLPVSNNMVKTISERTGIQVNGRTANYLSTQCKPAPLSYPTTLSPNTQYTVFHNRKNYNGSVKTPMINLGGTEVSATGSRTVVTTPSTLAHNELRFIGGENTVEQVMVLHGDWTKEGKTVDYFEGLQSSIIGDKTLENLVDEPTNLWSSSVTNSSNGGAVDYVSIDDIVVGYGNKPKLPEVQVDTDVRSYGMTLQNLAGSINAVRTQYTEADEIGYVTITNYSNYQNYFTKKDNVKPSTKYLIIVDIEQWENVEYGVSDSSEAIFISSNDGGSTNCFPQIVISKTDIGKGIHKFITTSKANLSDVNYGLRTFTYIKSGTIKYRIMLLEYQEGMENWNIPFFEGMKSVENPIYHSVGKNLWNKVEAFFSTIHSDSTPNEVKSYMKENNINWLICKDEYWKGDYSYENAEININPDSAYKGVRIYIGNLKPNTDYSISYDVTTSLGRASLKQSTSDTEGFVGFLIENDTKTSFTISNIQIEQGTKATPYEPYKSSILSTPQGTVLRGVGSYKDVIGWNDGIIRRNCVEFTITGEEGYSFYNIVENTNTIMCNISWGVLGLANKILSNDNVNMIICDKLQSMGGSKDTPHIRQDGGKPYSGAIAIWFDKTKFSTYTSQGVNDYIKSIGGLTIIAPLANTQYEDVEFTGGGNWNKIVLDGSEHWQEANEGDNANGFSVWFGLNEDAMKDYGNDNVSKYYLIESEELDWLKYSQIVGSRRTNFVVMNNTAMIVNVEGCHSVNEVKAWMAENPITVWYQTTSETINNTNPLIFNHGAVYTTTDTHPSTFLDFTLKTTNRYAVKGFDKLKYTILTKQPFYLNGINYPTSSTGMTIIDVTNVVDTSIYSDDPMITVVQEDGNYYADGVLQQFKGEQTFVKEFIRTSNGTYNTGMTLLEPLELNGLLDLDIYDTYNPITGTIVKNTMLHTLTKDEFKQCNCSINSTSNGFGGYTFHFGCSLQSSELNCLGHKVSFINNTFGATKVDIATYGSAALDCYFHYDASYGAMTVEDFKNLITEDLIFVYRLKTPQIIQATPTSTYISTRPENGNIMAQDTQIQAEYLNYDNEQSIISPRMLGDGDTIRWEQGSQCYVYENDNEYIPLTEHDELFGANIQAQEYSQYVESVEGAKVELGIALKEKAVYEQTYVKYEDNIIYPTTMENIDETNGVEVDYICGATWQNPNDLSDIRHLGELREDGQYDVTIRRSGDDEIRLLEGTTHIGLDYDVLPPSEFELTFFNNGGVEVGKYGDTTHVLEDCVQDSKLASGTIYGQTLVNVVDWNNVGGNSYTYELIDTGFMYKAINNNEQYITFGNVKANTNYTVRFNSDKAFRLQIGYDATVEGNKWNFYNIVVGYNEFTIKTVEAPSYDFIRLRTDSAALSQSAASLTNFMIIEGEHLGETIPYFEGMHSTVVNGFSSCGKNLWVSDDYGSYYTSGHTYVLNGYKPTYPLTLSSKTKRRCMTKGISVKPNSYYTISITDCDRDTSEYYLIVSFYRTKKDAIQNVTEKPTLVITTDSGKGISKTIKTPTDCNYVVCGIAIDYNYELNGGEIVLYEEPKIQFEVGQTQTSYESPQKVNYTLPTPIALRKVGDVCDTFDVTTGKLTQRIGEIVLNGSAVEEWSLLRRDSITNVFQIPISLNVKLRSDLLSNLFDGKYVETIQDGVEVIKFNNSKIYVNISNTKATTVEDFKSYIAQQSLTIQYQLATESVQTIDLIPSTTQTTQEPTFILPQPLRSVPNGICDRLYWDENKGHYCIEKRIEVLEINGTFNWSQEHLNSTHIGVYSYNIKTNTYSAYYSSLSSYFKCYPSASHNANDGREKITYVGNGSIKVFIATDKLTEATPTGVKQWFTENPTTYYRAQETPQIIDLPHLNEKVELPTQPDIYPIGYKAVHEKANPEIGLTIPYKVLNMPTQPTNLNFVMDIADYVLTWDDVKEARQYNVILNDNVIATVKEPHWNSGEEMYGYVLVEAQNEIGDSLSKELYIKTVPNAPAQLTVAHNPQTDFYDFEISFVDTSEIAEYFTVMYRVDNGEWVVEDIPAEDLELNTKVLIRFSIYEIKECIEVWATATNDVGTNDILPSAIYYMSPTPQWTYRINSKEAFLRWLDESPYDVQYKLRYSYKSNGIYQYAYFEGDASEIGKLYEAVLPLAEDDEVTVALCIISEKENLYSKPVKVSKALDPNIVPPLNFNYHWLARGLIEFYWEDQYNVDVEYEYILESMKSGEVLWQTITEVIPSRDVSGTGEVYKVEHQLEDLEQIRMKVRMKWAMNETEWSETLTTVFIPVEGNPPTYIRRTQTAEGLLIEWEAQSYIDGYHIYVIDNKTGEELQHIETLDNSILVDIDYSKSIEIAIYEISRFSGGIEAEATDPMVFTPTMLTTDIEQRIYQPTMEEYLIETSTVQKGSKEAYIIHDSTYTPNVETEEVLGVGISTPFIISYHPMAVDVHQAGSRIENTINAQIKTLDTRTEELVNVMTFERTTATYDLDFRVYTPSTASYPINVDISKVRIVCLGDSLTSGHPFYWAETGTGDVTASYPYQLSRRLKNQYEVINSGYG